MGNAHALRMGAPDEDNEEVQKRETELVTVTHRHVRFPAVRWNASVIIGRDLTCRRIRPVASTAGYWNEFWMSSYEPELGTRTELRSKPLRNTRSNVVRCLATVTGHNYENKQNNIVVCDQYINKNGM